MQIAHRLNFYFMMSELLINVLTEEFEIDDLISWIQGGDVTTIKDGTDPIEFSSFFLEFLKKHTRQLLSAQDMSASISVEENSASSRSVSKLDTMNTNPYVYKSYNFPYSLIKWPHMSDVFDTALNICRTPPIGLVPLECSASCSANNICDTSLKINITPLTSSASPVCSTTTTQWNCVGVNFPSSSSKKNIHLLEKRFTTKENNLRAPTQTIGLLDIPITVKEKQGKKKKRIQPMRCGVDGRNNMQVPLANTIDSISRCEQVKIDKKAENIRRVKPVPANKWKELPISQSTPLKTLKCEIFPSENLLIQMEMSEQNFQLSQNKPVNQTTTVANAMLLSPIQSSSVAFSNTEINQNVQQDNPNSTTVNVSSTNNHKYLISKIAKIYSAILTSNYIQDLLKEISFLMCILVSNEKLESPQIIPCTCSLESIKNGSFVQSDAVCLFRLNQEGVFFATLVLEEKWNMFKYLNKSTLMILCSNASLKTRSPEFVDKINGYIVKKSNAPQEVSIVNHELFNETVKFKMDTDCRSNYDNEKLFCAFKKQRDLFYSLLHDWENELEHGTSANFFKTNHKLLRSLFICSNASINMYKLAELFVSQILASVFNEDMKSCEKLNVNGVPMNKFYLLYRRFVTPCSIQTSNDKKFPGVQEFFKDFLRSCECHAFVSHVKDVLICKIVSFNEVKFSLESVASVRQECFLLCLNKLCLLAKFLSLVIYLPYKDREPLPLHLRIPLIEARKSVPVPLDIDYFLSEALKSGRLLITVPWIVEFLNGIDDTSKHLPYFSVIFAKLQYLLYKIKLPLSTRDGEDIFIIVNENVSKSLNIIDDEKVELKKLELIASQSDDEILKTFVDECWTTVDCSRILITLYVNSLFNNVTVSNIIKVEGTDPILAAEIWHRKNS